MSQRQAARGAKLEPKYLRERDSGRLNNRKNTKANAVRAQPKEHCFAAGGGGERLSGKKTAEQLLPRRLLQFLHDMIKTVSNGGGLLEETCGVDETTKARVHTMGQRPQLGC